MLNGLSNDDLEKAIGKQPSQDGAPGSATPGEEKKEDGTGWTEVAVDVTGMDMDEKTKEVVEKLKARA
eukprot:12997834-Heterocapsa_arctica.AAC.1